MPVTRGISPQKVAEYEDEAGEKGEEGHGEGDDAHNHEGVELCHCSFSVSPSSLSHISPFSAAGRKSWEHSALERFLLWLMENW